MSLANKIDLTFKGPMHHVDKTEDEKYNPGENKAQAARKFLIKVLFGYFLPRPTARDRAYLSPLILC